MPVPEDYKYDLPFDNDVGQDAFRIVPKAPDLEDVDEEYKKINCYNGNEALMAKSSKFPYTQAHIDEWKKCRDDVFYFLTNYATITSLDSGIIKFALYQYQKNMIKIAHENRFSIFLLPRQMGKCYTDDTIITIRNKKTGVVETLTIGKFKAKIKGA